MGARKVVDGRLDRLRFLLDRQRLDYQPMPWLGIEEAPRSIGVRSRWKEMSRMIGELEVGSAVDLGCNVGFYVVSLAQQGIAALGIEGDARYARVLSHARTKLGLDQAGVCVMKLNPATVQLVPHADVTIFLAVWHHFVREFGLDVATSMLTIIWSGTRRVMFFETGQNEMPEEFGLPNMGDDPAGFVTSLLVDACPGARIEDLGEHDAFDADRRPCRRTLFAVIRLDG